MVPGEELREACGARVVPGRGSKDGGEERLGRG